MNDILSLGDWIHTLAKILKKETDSRLARLSLGQGQFLLFMFLLKHAVKEPCSQEQIARAMDLNKANVSRNVAKLEEKGLVEILPDRENARKRLVKLTPRALRMGKDMGGQFQEIHGKMTAGIDEQRLAQTVEVLRSMAVNLRQDEEKK